MTSQIYIRGFVLARDSIVPPEGFTPGPIFDNFFIGPLTPVDSAAQGDLAVVVLGTCVSTESDGTAPSSWIDRLLRKPPVSQPSAEPPPAKRLLDALAAGETQFFNAVDQYCGRHAILFRSNGNVRILTDATGMRTVFYAAEGGVVASHARLVEETLGGEIQRIDLPFRYGYPGNHTPYIRTRLLTPNTFYDFAQGKVVRFWPRGPIKSLTVQQATEIVLQRTTTALQRIAPGKRVTLSITAGIDSRTTMALALRAGIKFDGYTYDRGGLTVRDGAVATDLARIAGIEHHTIPTLPPRIPEELKSRLQRATYYEHHQPVVAPMQRHLGGNQALAVSANLLEIGRYFYKGQEFKNLPPDNPDSMAEFSLLATKMSASEMEEQFGPEPVRLAKAYYADFIRDTDFNAARGLLDPRDQFYWEFKMSAWHAMILLERDFYADGFIPFNSRSIFETLLGVPEYDRRKSTVFKLLIKRSAPQLISSIPINPKQWPLEPRTTKEVARDTLRWAKEQGIRVEHLMNDNGLGHVSRLVRRTLKKLGMRHIRTEH